MEHLSNVMLIESQRQSREQESKRVWRGEPLPRQPIAWRAYLVVAVVLVGLIVWWII